MCNVQCGHDGDAFGNGVLGPLRNVTHLAIDQVDGSISASRSSGAQATRYSRPMILTSRKFGSAVISGILGNLVHQAFETLTGGGHSLPQMQSF
jgi:hypothetical protein